MFIVDELGRGPRTNDSRLNNSVIWLAGLLLKSLLKKPRGLTSLTDTGFRTDHQSPTDHYET